MSHRVIECPGCLSKLRFRSDSHRASITCPRCQQKIVVTREVDEEELLDEVEPLPEPEPVRPRRRTGPAARAGRDRRPAPRTARSPRYEDDEADYHDDPADDDFDYFGVDPAAESESRFQGIAPFAIGAAVGLVLLGIAVGIWWFQRSGQVEPAPAIADTQPSPAASGFGVDQTTAPETQPAPPPAARQPPGNNAPTNTAPNTSPERPGRQTQPAAPVPAASPGGLRYRWAPGDEHIYALKIVADHGGGQQTINGSCTYKIRNNGRVNTEESEGSGTGFVVAANGFIATCAHVVEGARDIQVTIGNKTYPGRVVLNRPKLDLAMVRIDASALPVAALGDSDNVQLAEPVRAFGFPLSSLLGTGIKVATGSVAGVVMHPKHGRQIQTDAPINPGNSGGPIVNESGQVIGVASSKIASRAASSVGFAVPINEVAHMMEELGLPRAPQGGGKKLDGPAVARGISPTVAYIKVKGSTGGRVFDVAFTASYIQTESVDPRQFRFGGFPAFPTHTDDRGVLQVSSSGEIVESTGKGSLPYVLGPIGQFFIEPLGSGGDTAWSNESETALNIVKRASNDPLDRMRSRMPIGPRGFGGRGFGGRFGPPGLDPFGGQPQEQTIRVIPARERSTYRVKGENQDRITIRKTYEFRTTDNENRPYLVVRGSGDLVFDKTLGVPTSLEYEATLTQTEPDGSSSRLPLTITYTRRDNEEVRRERAAAMARVQERKKQQELDRTMPNAELVDKLLAEISGGTDSRILSPIKRLAGLAVVPERRVQVMVVAVQQLKNSNGFVQGAAADIAAKWATADHVDVLKQIAGNRNSLLRSGRKAAVTKLIELKVPDLLPLLVKEMQDSSFRHDLKPLLITAGVAAEQPILDVYEDNPDTGLRRDLLEILGKIGTDKSVPLLTREATGTNRSLRSPAQRALDAIRARQ